MCALVPPPRPILKSLGPGWVMLLSLSDDASSDIVRLLRGVLIVEEVKSSRWMGDSSRRTALLLPSDDLGRSVRAVAWGLSPPLSEESFDEELDRDINGMVEEWLPSFSMVLLCNSC